jgi:hypothetical protein
MGPISEDEAFIEKLMTWNFFVTGHQLKTPAIGIIMPRPPSDDAS